MRVFYQLAKGRVVKSEMVVELSMFEIMGLMFGREIRLEQRQPPVVLRNGQAYRAYNRSAPGNAKA
jgi:hypothetical protein